MTDVGTDWIPRSAGECRGPTGGGTVRRWSEASRLATVGNGWRQLYGGFYDVGVSVEWHEFELPHAFEWSRSFHPESLELCLNWPARLGQLRGKRFELRAIDGGVLLAGKKACRHGGMPASRIVSYHRVFAPVSAEQLGQVRRSAPSAGRELCARRRPAPGWGNSPAHRRAGTTDCPLIVIRRFFKVRARFGIRARCWKSWPSSSSSGEGRTNCSATARSGWRESAWTGSWPFCGESCRTAESGRNRT